MPPIKVLLVTDGMEVGGTQRQICLLARTLDRSLVLPEVLFFRTRSFLVDELLEAGIPTTLLPKSRPLDPVFVWRLRRRILHGGYDVVHAFSFTAEIWSAVAGALSNRPVLITSVRGRNDTFSPLGWRLKAWAARRSCIVVANSEAGASYAAERMRYPAQKIRVVRNGVSLSGAPAGAVRKELGLSEGDVVGLFLGRLVPNKNVASLLKASALLSGNTQGFVLLIAGSGPVQAELSALASELGIAGQVHFLGERRDAAAVLDASSFLVLPSRKEGMSNVILEAMTAGRPVVASDIPSNREIVTHDVTGLLYQSGNEAALAAALRRMIDDGQLRSRLGAAGRERAAREFSSAAMARAMESIYVECARARRERATAGR